MALKLIKLRKEDIFLVMKWRMDPEVAKYMYTDPSITKESQMKWFSKISNDDTCCYWIIEFDEKKIGLLYLSNIDNKNKRCFWGYYIADTSFRGRGIGGNLECNIYDYVFDKLKLNKLCGEVLEENNAVVQIHKKFGSKIEGLFKKHIFKNGEFKNVVRMGILKEDWIMARDNYEYEIIQIE